MRAEVSQPPVLAPGFALVTVTDVPALDPASLVFSVEQPPRGFLQELGAAPWGTTHAWLRPSSASVGEDGQGLALTLGPEHTWNLRPNVTYILRLRDAARTEPFALRIAWKGIRMPSQPPQKLSDLPQPKVEEKPPVVPPVGAVTEPVKETPKEPAKELVPDPVPRRVNKLLWIALAVLLLLGLGGGAWFMLHRKPAEVVTKPEPPPPQPSPSEGPLGAATARAYLQKTPASSEIYTEAQRYLKDGSPEALQGGLILLTRAADAGSGPAQTAIGRMYDPDTFTPQTSAMKAPDPDKALLWYQRAAQSNDPEGLYRLGKLLMSGHASAPGLGPEQGVTALQRAAELGSKDAQQELDKLRNNPH